nr:RlmE family RNA methyltransferase [Luteithermobacter gelatinilyticus]|tara:strand:- start:7687 stop:8418 length:732 start_codon:yes stop_codon:yes gene_type:complete
MIKKPKLTRTGKPRMTHAAGITRGRKHRVKTAKGRRLSSTRWLERQLNDPYVAAAQRDGYRSRAAYKLIELDEKYHFLKDAHTVVDLGAAPGGWTQVASQRCPKDVRLVGIDLLPVDPIAGATILEMDFMADGADKALKKLIDGDADLVLSDMAASTIGHPQTDHLRTIALVEAAYFFARDVLSEGGAFVAKVFRGGTDHELLELMKGNFRSVRHYKPPASRPESPETYVVAQGFRKSGLHEV